MAAKWEMPEPKRHYRVKEGKQVGGVCAGLADRNGKSANYYRWCYVLAHFLGMPMFTVYLIQWAAYPLKEPSEKEQTVESVE